MSTFHSLRQGFFLALCLAASQTQANAQTADDADEPVGRESGVGYIDSAVPQSQFRLRYDSAYRNNRPTRAEYFYPRGGASGPGLPRPESRVDYQDVSAYLEIAYQGRVSLFVEAPYRFLNPTVNDNADGFGDLKVGAKWAFWETDQSLLTAQFKVYVPTGDSDRGLGTNHVSFEPALLFQQRLAHNLVLEGETRYWVASGGTDFQGDALQYGLGLTLGERHPHAFWATPVTEFVGWTFLSGKEVAFDGVHPATIESADGNTIVNGKVGVRFGWGDRMDLYAGYGRALTGAVLYKDSVRLEMRWKF